MVIFHSYVNVVPHEVSENLILESHENPRLSMCLVCRTSEQDLTAVWHCDGGASDRCQVISGMIITVKGEPKISMAITITMD